MSCVPWRHTVVTPLPSSLLLISRFFFRYMCCLNRDRSKRNLPNSFWNSWNRSSCNLVRLRGMITIRDLLVSKRLVKWTLIAQQLLQNLKFIYQSMLPAISCFVDNFHVWPIEYQHPVALEETTKRSSIPEETRRASNEPFSVALLPLDADKLATGIPRAPFRPNKIKSLGEEEIFKENSRLVCSAGTSKRASRELIISRGL